jgi:hypothetical protein
MFARKAEPLHILRGIRDGANLIYQNLFDNAVFFVGATIVYLLCVNYMGTVFQYLAFKVRRVCVQVLSLVICC